MATPNKLEIVLSFKPLMDGLNTFVNGYKSRMATVQAFNQKIQNGEAALRQMVGQVGAVLGGAALVKYARDAREADKVQAQLIQTLRKTGQTGALEALNSQAAALQRVTEFSDEAVNTVQRLLISFGLSAQQAEGLTEQVLDFAQATGQSAESAAMLIGRTLAGDSDELGRYQIKLDTTKGKVDALRDALGRYAGQARAAVPDAAQREIAARYADATENLGRVANQAATPFLQALIPLLEKVAAWATANATNIAAMAGQLGDMAAAAAPVILALGALAGGAKLVLAVVNPLRSAVVLLSGRSLVELSNALATSSGGARGLWAALAGGSTGLVGAVKGLGAAVSALGGVFSAGLAGWQLGTMANEIELNGLKIKDWVAIAMVWIGDKLMMVWDGLRAAWVVTKAEGEAFWDALKLATLAGVLAVLDAWNKLPFNKPLEVDLSPLRQEFEATVAHLKGSGARLTAELDRIAAEQEKRKQENKDLAKWIKDHSGAPSTGSTTGGAAAGGGTGPNLNDDRFSNTDAKEKADAELKAKREAYDLDTRILQARLAGDQKLEQSLTLERDFKRDLAELGEGAIAQIDRRQAAEVALAAQERERQMAEQAFSRDIGTLEAGLAQIEQERSTTQQEKDAARVVKLGEINAKIAERIALLEQEQLRNPDPTRQGQIDDLRAKQGSNQASIAAAQPQTLGEGALQGIKGQGGFLEGLGTAAQNAASAVSGTLNSALNATQGLLYNLASGAMSFRQAWGQAILQVGQQFLQSMTMMVAKMIWRATVERALTAMGVTLHVAGEQTKTGATLMGGVKRLAMTAKEALADVFHGAVAAFKAMASIPYVGPVLGAAAMAAALAGGMALVKSISAHEQGGIVEGGRQLSWLNENGTEAVIRASSVRKFGPRFFSDLNAGALNLAALPSSIAAQLPAAAARSSAALAGSPALSPAANPQALLDQERRGGAGGFNGNVIVAMGEDYLHDAIASTTGERLVVRASARNRRRIGIRT